MNIVALAEMEDGQEADLFALLAAKEQLRTREGKRYFRVTFRDARREVTFPIWSDGRWAEECRNQWVAGAFYKLRAIYRQTVYGPQLEIAKIRETRPADAEDGFDPLMCQLRSRHDPKKLFDALAALVRRHVPGALGQLTLSVLEEHRETLLGLPAAVHHHHAYVGGFLEHALSVAESCVYLAKKYRALYPELSPPLDLGLTVAGGALHDIGKVLEIEQRPTGAAYTPAGHLLGHLSLGRDVIRAAGEREKVDPETLLRLEHVIVSHHSPEWGSPKPPMTPEALIVFYAENLDARFQMMAQALAEDSGNGLVTGTHNALKQAIYRGPG